MFINKFIQFVVKRRKPFVNRAIRDQTGPISSRNITNKVFFRESRIVTDFSPLHDSEILKIENG